MVTQTQLKMTGIVWLVCVLLCATPSANALDSKPHVIVRVEIQAPAFVRNLPQRLQSQDALSEHLAKLFAQRYAFADWPTAPRATEAELGGLLLRLEEDASSVPNPSIVLRWYGVFGADPTKLTPLQLDP